MPNTARDRHRMIVRLVRFWTEIYLEPRGQRARDLRRPARRGKDARSGPASYSALGLSSSTRQAR